MLEAKVPDLRTPAEEEGVEGEHGGDVAHADVADVDAPDDNNDIDDESQLVMKWVGSLIEKRGESFVINYPNINQISVFSSLFGEWLVWRRKGEERINGTVSLKRKYAFGSWK